MARVLRAIALAVPLVLIASLILARFSESARQGLANVVVFGAHCQNFFRMAPARDKHCSLAEAWRLALDFETAAELKRLENSFQVVRSDGALDLISTPRADFWIPHRDRHSLAEMLMDQDRGIYDSGGKGIRRGDVVLDCGANVGVYTRHALNQGASLVVAIEPAPENLECLRRNFVKEIAARRVVIYAKGVWDHDALLPMHTSSAFSSLADSVVLGGDQTLAQVELTTIDKLVRELGLSRVGMIKMDIEGAERQALAGALDTVAKFKPRLAIAVEHFPDDIDKIPTLLAKQWPGMQTACGACEHIINPKVDRIQPAVVFGRWD